MMVIKINGNVFEVVNASCPAPMDSGIVDASSRVANAIGALVSGDAIESVKETASSYIDAFIQFIHESLI